MCLIVQCAYCSFSKQLILNKLAEIEQEHNNDKKHINAQIMQSKVDFNLMGD